MEMRFKIAWAVSLVLLLAVLMMPSITTFAVKPGGSPNAPGGGGQGNPPPTVSTVWPTVTTQYVQTQFKVNASDNKEVSSCDFFWQSVNQGAMTRISGTPKAGTWARYYTPTSSGTFVARADCTDNSGKKTTGPNTNIQVNPPPSNDTQSPSVSSVTPTSAQFNVPTNYSVTASDNVGVSYCSFYWDGVNRGLMSGPSGAPSGTWWEIWTENGTTGVHTAQGRCQDAAGNVGLGALTNVTINPSDTQPPVVSSVAPTSAQVYVPTDYQVTASDNVGVTNCNFIWDYANIGAMTLVSGNSQNGVWQKTWTQNGTGNYGAYATCYDAANNGASGPGVNVTVS